MRVLRYALVLLLGILIGWPLSDFRLSRFSNPLEPIMAMAQTGGGSWTFDQSQRSYFVTTDFTTASASLVNITGLGWTMPANYALTVSFICELEYSQATAAVADAFGIQDVTVAPTNLNARGAMATNTTAVTFANLPTLTSTTATNIVSATPSAITTIWNAHLSGLVEQPSNSSSSAVNIMVLTGNASDSITVKRGSFCKVF